MERDKMVCNGYLTVYLTFLLTILLSLYLALLEGVRYNAIRLKTEMVMDIAMSSVMAEYHRELFDQYNLFAIDSSYGTGVSGVWNTQEHLRKYLEKNLSQEDGLLSGIFYRDFFGMHTEDVVVTGVRILTDDEGKIFRKRAIEAIRNDVGIGLMEDLARWIGIVEENHFLQRDISEEQMVIDREIQEYYEEHSEESVQQDMAAKKNPMESVNKLRNKGVLWLVTDEPDMLSAKDISELDLVGNRLREERISKGNLISVEDETDNNTVIQDLSDRFFFQEYLLKYMGRYGLEEEGDALSYQVEYLVVGKENDIDNLKGVVNRLCGIREAANAFYLYSDPKHMAEAEAAGLTLATAMLIPEAAELFKHAILLAWAYVESLQDVQKLLEGGSVPIMKTEASWETDLWGMIEGTEAEVLSGAGEEREGSQVQGLDYEDYMRVLMSFVNLDTLTRRALDMVEADIRNTDGNGSFRMDSCYDWIEADICITSDYGYAFQILRDRRY